MISKERQKNLRNDVLAYHITNTLSVYPLHVRRAARLQCWTRPSTSTDERSSVSSIRGSVPAVDPVWFQVLQVRIAFHRSWFCAAPLIFAVLLRGQGLGPHPTAEPIPAGCSKVIFLARVQEVQRAAILGRSDRRGRRPARRAVTVRLTGALPAVWFGTEATAVILHSCLHADRRPRRALRRRRAVARRTCPTTSPTTRRRTVSCAAGSTVPLPG